MTLNFLVQVLRKSQFLHAFILHIFSRPVPFFPCTYPSLRIQFFQGLAESHYTQCGWCKPELTIGLQSLPLIIEIEAQAPGLSFCFGQFCIFTQDKSKTR